MDKYLKENEVMEDQQSTEQQINQPIAPNEAFLSQPQPEVKTSATNSSKKNAFTKFFVILDEHVHEEINRGNKYF